LNACLFIARDPASLPDRAGAVMMFGEATPDHNRARVLAGVSLAGVASPGPTVCACFAVGRNTIVEEIRSRNIATVAGISAALRAGTNCGSCLPELAVILNETRAEEGMPSAEEPSTDFARQRQWELCRSVERSKGGMLVKTYLPR